MAITRLHIFENLVDWLMTATLCAHFTLWLTAADEHSAR